MRAHPVKDGELKGVTDLLAPKWNEKIAISDRRVIGSTFWPSVFGGGGGA